MQRILLTGMSGTGKSTVIEELAARGYMAVDTDSDEWSEWVTIQHDTPAGRVRARDWIWREERIEQLLAGDHADVLFVSGCKSNQGTFYHWFDEIILLSAPAEVLVARIAARSNNSYGKHPDELAEILGYLHTVEPLLRRCTTLEVDTSAPLSDVLAAILATVRTAP